jgi:D-alanyl-D-alanine carboxypeptidase
VIAEGVAGSESAFAARMTAKARELGMANTTFVNASGLPNPLNRTTARDLSKLARALYRDFPREYAYFSTEEFTFHGVTYSNHNHLMASFQGMDGIKTGFIRASGFNLAASAVRDHRRLIGIVMGGTSAHSRDMKMAELLNTGFVHQGAPDVIVTADQSGPAKIGRLARRAAHTLASLSPIGRAEASTTGHAVLHLRAKEGQGWSIQIGAYTHHAAALRAGSAALAHLPAASGRNVMVLVSHAGKARVYRTRIASFSEAEAQQACRTLHRQHKACAIVAPSAAQMAGSHSSSG